LEGDFMAKYTYLAIFEKELEGGFSIYFPDIEGCYTQSDDIAEGIENAKDALCLMLYELEKQGAPIPKATSLNDNTSCGDNIVTLMIDCDTHFYKNYFEGRQRRYNESSAGA